MQSPEWFYEAIDRTKEQIEKKINKKINEVL